MSRDLFFFVIVYVLAIGAALIDSRSIKIVIAVILALCYVLYVWLHVKAGDDSHGEAPELGPLWFQRGAESPKLIFIALQLVFALGLIVGGAHVFVHSVETVSHALGMSTLILALFIVPLASELPEKFNSVIWVYQKKGHAGLRQHFGRNGLAKLRGADNRHRAHRLGADLRERPRVYQRGRIAGSGGPDRPGDENVGTPFGALGSGGRRTRLLWILGLHNRYPVVTPYVPAL